MLKADIMRSFQNQIWRLRDVESSSATGKDLILFTFVFILYSLFSFRDFRLCNNLHLNIFATYYSISFPKILLSTSYMGAYEPEF